MQFSMRDSPRGLPDSDSPIDKLIRVAGGEPLPGVLGIAQLVANIWTEKRDGPAWLRHCRAALLTAGVIRSYRNGATGQRVFNAIDAAIKEQGLEAHPELAALEHMIYNKLMASGSRYEDTKHGAGIFRRFAGGIVFVFYSKESADERGKTFFGGELYTEAGKAKQAKDSISDAIWSGVEYGIELSTSESFGHAMFHFGAMNPPDEFVDADDSRQSQIVNTLTDRVTRFKKAGISRKVLFYGHPGNGKSLLAKELALRTGNGRVLRLDPEAVSTASNSTLTRLIVLLNPSVVLLDDMDRANGANGLLNHLESSNSTLVVGTVNAVRQLDPALLRPGRFDEVVHIGEPDQPWLRKIINHYAKMYNVSLPDDAPERMAGLSPAEVREAVKVAGIVGPDLLDTEIERLRIQRKLYDGEAVEAYLRRQRPAGREMSV